MNAPWSQPTMTQEELEYWERRREERLAKHPIDYDAMEASEEEEEEEEEEAV